MCVEPMRPCVCLGTKTNSKVDLKRVYTRLGRFGLHKGALDVNARVFDKLFAVQCKDSATPLPQRLGGHP